MSNPFLDDNPFTRTERDKVVEQLLQQHNSGAVGTIPFGSPVPLSSTSSAATGGNSTPKSLPTTSSPPIDEIPLRGNSPFTTKSANSGTAYVTPASRDSIYPQSASWSANGSNAGE